MRSLALFCGGMADEPREELSGQTPLAVAKTPFIDSLQKLGRTGSANFIPRSLNASVDIACLSILGYDPAEFYTGLAPLEALAMGIALDDRDVAFRYDFITASDDTFVDLTGRVSRYESDLLAGDLNSGIGGKGLRFYPGDDNRGILVFKDSNVSEELDDLTCMPPSRAAGQKISKCFPQGKWAHSLKEVFEKAKKILECHEINRVRIDLKENPANRIWLWGQGKRPKLPSFLDRYGIRGTVVSEALWVRGLAKGCGLPLSASFSEALKNETEFVLVLDPAKAGDIKTKIRMIERFDSQIVGAACRYALKYPETRILVGTDLSWPVGRSCPEAGDVPFLIQGPGIAAETDGCFDESAVSRRKGLVFDEGHQLMAYFLERKK